MQTACFLLVKGVLQQVLAIHIRGVKASTPLAASEAYGSDVAHRLGTYRFLSGAPAVGTHMTAIAKMYARWAAGDMGEDDQWGDVTAEPRGLDYVEVSADGVPAMWLVPHGVGPDRAIVAFHGGGFVTGSLYTHRKLYGHLAKAAGVQVLLATYRKAPEFRFPAQVEDAVRAYRWARARTRTLALAGDSSGGGLAVQVALREPGVAALLLLSPWIDMDPAQPAASYDDAVVADVFFTRSRVQGLVAQYLPEGHSGLTPEVNAFHADLSALPPSYVQCGGDESGRGDSERLAKLTGARLDVFDGQLHTFQMAAGRAPVADEAIGRLAAWVRPKLGL
jgi:epsilon-lactone hydrolase